MTHRVQVRLRAPQRWRDFLCARLGHRRVWEGNMVRCSRCGHLRPPRGIGHAFLGEEYMDENDRDPDPSR